MKTTSIASTRSLRNLYFVRTAFQVVWAASVIITAMKQPLLAAVLFLLYPLWDVACTVYDLNTFSKSGSSRTSQIVNAVLGVAAAIGIGLTVFQTPIYAVAIFGVWAFGAGVLQLVAGLIRRKELGGGRVEHDLERCSISPGRNRLRSTRPPREATHYGCWRIRDLWSSLLSNWRHPAHAQAIASPSTPGDLTEALPLVP